MIYAYTRLRYQVRVYRTNVPLVVFSCGSLPVFGIRVSVTFHLMWVHIIFSSFSVAGWPPFGEKLHTRLIICSRYILTICNISYFTFRFLGLDLGSDCFSS